MTPLRAFAGATILGIVVAFVHAAFAQTASSPAYLPYPPGENHGTKDVGGGPMTPGDAAGVAPLFTDFTSSHLGPPKHLAMPYDYETTPDSFECTPNPQGFACIDRGVGDFLRWPLTPHAGWTQSADQFDGRMQNPTLRNVDMRPSPACVQAYMHHGS